MEDGFVMDFTNRSFENFVIEALGVNPYDDKYSTWGSSKANRLRAIWEKESDYRVGLLTREMLDYWKDKIMIKSGEMTKPEEYMYNQCYKIAQGLLNNTIVEEINVINDFNN